MRKRSSKHRKSTCSKCGKEKEDSRKEKQAYCKACHAEHMRNKRPRHRDLKPAAKLKANARAYLHVYVKKGKIKKEPCRVCGAPAQAHHEDHTKPLEVIWLCRAHHLELHGYPQV